MKTCNGRWASSSQLLKKEMKEICVHLTFFLPVDQCQNRKKKVQNEDNHF